jgi:hypothetical protein
LICWVNRDWIPSAKRNKGSKFAFRIFRFDFKCRNPIVNYMKFCNATRKKISDEPRAAIASFTNNEFEIINIISKLQIYQSSGRQWDSEWTFAQGIPGAGMMQGRQKKDANQGENMAAVDPKAWVLKHLSPSIDSTFRTNSHCSRSTNWWLGEEGAKSGTFFVRGRLNILIARVKLLSVLKRCNGHVGAWFRVPLWYHRSLHSVGTVPKAGRLIGRPLGIERFATSDALVMDHLPGTKEKELSFTRLIFLMPGVSPRYGRFYVPQAAGTTSILMLEGTSILHFVSLMSGNIGSTLWDINGRLSIESESGARQFDVLAPLIHFECFRAFSFRYHGEGFHNRFAGFHRPSTNTEPFLTGTLITINS